MGKIGGWNQNDGCFWKNTPHHPPPPPTKIKPQVVGVKKKNPISTLKIATKNGTHSKSSSMNSPFGNNLCVIGAFNEKVICLSETSKPGMICETRARVCGGHHRVKTINFLKLYKFWKSGVIYLCSNLLYNYLNLITVFF